MKQRLMEWAKRHPGITSVIYPSLYRRFVDDATKEAARSEYPAMPEAEHEVERLREVTKVELPPLPPNARGVSTLPPPVEE